ncbi:MAG TPA: hypothetical protein VJW55_06615 [Candidatus Angelobacter sp.]|jgi:hypothetical protein|nr:hypothetical protein [Candidatus Angelobacter sp.]
MSPQRAKWSDAEHEVLVKLHHGYTLTRQDHSRLAQMYEAHGANSVYVALGKLRDGRPLERALAPAKARTSSKR